MPKTQHNPSDNPASPGSQLRALLQSAELEFLMEAHNGLSARIVQEAGFKGIWASGLALSAQYGVRDNNEASWTQIVDMLEFMSDVVDIPILLDGDTGYGNFNNMRRLVRKLEQRRIGGVCIEDKQFPKTNSFISGERQPLASIDEFSGKIKAGKDSQSDDNFCIVARIEALIAGWGMDEALRRAEAYFEAGADAILIHSKLSRPDEILAFAKEWANRSPLVIVPTKYYTTPSDVFRSAGISTVIWANHLLRASTTAMQNAAAQIKQSESLIDIEDSVASVNEIFRLQGAEELADAESRYLQSEHTAVHAIVLAASRGDELEGLTSDRPKVMLPIAGKPLLRRQVDAFKNHSVNDITVVAGYKADAIDVQGIDVVINKDYAESGELQSLLCAKDAFDTDTLCMYGDLLFRSYVLGDLLQFDHPVTVVVDSALGDTPVSGTPDYAWCSTPDDRSLFGQEVLLKHIADQDADRGTASGRWIGMVLVRGAGRTWVTEALQTLQQQDDFASLSITALLNQLVSEGHPVQVMYINGHWLDVNNLDDLDRAGTFAHSGQHNKEPGE